MRGRAFTTRVDFDSIEAAHLWLDRICGILNAESGSEAKTEKSLRSLEIRFERYDLVNMTGTSYRIKETKRFLEQK